jgi:hypothetical protein
MHWSNGFSNTLVLRCRPFGRRRCRSAHCSPGGRWRLERADGTWVVAGLNAAWLAGAAAGLAWTGTDGQRYQALVLAAGQAAADWRRLRVQLKLPRNGAG